MGSGSRETRGTAFSRVGINFCKRVGSDTVADVCDWCCLSEGVLGASKRVIRMDNGLGLAVAAALRKRASLCRTLRAVSSLRAPRPMNKEGALFSEPSSAPLRSEVCSMARMFLARTSAAGTSNGRDEVDAADETAAVPERAMGERVRVVVSDPGNQLLSVDGRGR